MTPSDAQMAQVLANGRQLTAASVALRGATRSISFFFIVSDIFFTIAAGGIIRESVRVRHNYLPQTAQPVCFLKTACESPLWPFVQSIVRICFQFSGFSKNFTESPGHLDIRPGVVQPGHPGKEDIQTKRIDRFQAVRVDGYGAVFFNAFVKNMDQFPG
jgi:hypothetical protein